jgi:hypothetical protein
MPLKGLQHIFSIIIDAFAKRHQGRWLSKKRQLQGARLSSNEAYLCTSKQQDDCSNAADEEFLRRHHH